MYMKHSATLCCLILAFGANLSAWAESEPRALAISHENPALEWGPCPEFLPEGCAVAVLNGDPAGNNADVFFRLPENSAIAPHWHTSAERMVLVSGRLQLTYDGQEQVVLTPGMYAYGPAKLPHHGFCEAGDPCVLFIAFESPVDAVPLDP
jgi:mannose-6-phosphate isomerase-like protein (cupin superfamily)